MNKEQAEKTFLVAAQANYILDSYLSELKQSLEPEEFSLYCKKFGKIMSTTFSEVLNPIFEQYPELVPEKMGGSYKTNDEHYNTIRELVIRQSKI
jgi:ABC-type transporter MlaC component